jgi:hypothetical protein
MDSFPDDDAEAQHELALERLAQSVAVAQWAAEHAMPADLMTHLLYELGLSLNEAPHVDFQPF